MIQKMLMPRGGQTGTPLTRDVGQYDDREESWSYWAEIHLSITSPFPSAVIGTRPMFQGVASVEVVTQYSSPSESWETREPGNHLLNSMQIEIANVGTFTATPNGPAENPWVSWRLDTAGFPLPLPAGPLLVKVTATTAPYGQVSAASQTLQATYAVDATPPTLSVAPPADVRRASPPYIATLNGSAADNASGVASIHWEVPGVGQGEAPGGANWTAQIPLPGLGNHSVRLRARDGAGNVSADQTVVVRVIDVTAPSLSIDEPPVDALPFPLVDGQTTIEVRGTASDSQTGVAIVEWALDGGSSHVSCVPRAADDWSTWSALVRITEAGNHTITVRARDKATAEGNVITLERAIVVAEPFEPKDPDAIFGPSSYLDDLLDFTGNRVKVAEGGAFVSRQNLADAYLQPFDELVLPRHRTAANRPTSQIRLCIEVLRRYLARHGRGVPEGAESAYRLAVYTAVLRELGTSHEEMRLARVANAASRDSLAARLGIALGHARPDRLDELLLQPAELSEAALQQLFGLEETLVRPLAESVLPEPALLVWQKERLRAIWLQQDDAARTVWNTPVPVVDPDMLGEWDLRTPSPGNPAYDLWKARQQDMAAHVAVLDNLRRAQPSQIAGFDAVVTPLLGPADELTGLMEARNGGAAIDDTLATKRIPLPAFVHLMGMRRLAEADSLLEPEWNDVYAILAQVRKAALYELWRMEESARGILLGPDHFRVANELAALVMTLPAWRASLQARQAWRRTLASREEQEQTLQRALETVVGEAEKAALPGLRDACLAGAADGRDLLEVADALSRELGIDCREGGHLQTTRALQALETLQSVLLTLRTGRLKGQPPVLGNINPAAQWVLAIDPAKPYTESDFDQEWLWMGGYATWNAAIRVFAYPESYLLPELRPVQTKAFRDLSDKLRNHPRLTPVQARKLAGEYLAGLKQELAPRPGDTLPPLLQDPGFKITEALTDTELASRRIWLRDQIFAGVTVPSLAPEYLQEIFHFVPTALALQLQQSGQFLAALDWIETVYTDHLASGERKIYPPLVMEESIVTRYQRNPDDWLRVGLNPHQIVTARANAHTRFLLMNLAACYLDFADAEFTRDDGESLARARALYANALELLALPAMQPPMEEGARPSPFPPNPVPAALKARAEMNLFKLRNGRNIAGIPRQTPLLEKPSATMDRVPVAGEMQRTFRPTPYRYAVLIERAKGLVNIAQQVEQAFLAALEKRDAENYNRLKAGHDLDLAKASVTLQGLRVTEASQGITLAERQQDRIEVQRETYSDWIHGGLNRYETAVIASQIMAGIQGVALAHVDASLTVAQAAASAASGGPMGAAGGSAALGLISVLAGSRAGTASLMALSETTAQLSATQASYERREQEWRLQYQLAESELATSRQQIELAKAHWEVVQQEQSISTTQQTQAQATLDFLAQKFTNAELYQWMSGILGGAYNYFLQQATAMAQLAQHQLAFERQETPPAFIKADYWEDTRNVSGTTDATQPQPDRQGLTGSVRLLQDITRLDQFAFETNRRKLQLAETLSLARLFPVEFQQFRETGRLPFATPMSVFDQGFPGHYLRLIKRVRVSLVALIPPVRGVRASLGVSGISRVVVGNDAFQTITLRREPELIAFTGTTNATGLLDLEADEGMLRPFESMGVDTTWELQLPKAANPFDFRGIADVLFTVEYTALENATYRQQVIQNLADTVSAERILSVRDHFADQWYALHNPDATDTPLSVGFRLGRDHFPPNLDDIRVQQVLLAVIRANGQSFELGPVRLMLTPDGGTIGVGGTVGGSVDGLISTRRGSGSAWIPLLGQSPFGNWTLNLPDTPEMRARLANEEIDDLVLILTYQGRTPPWPV